MKPLSHLDGDAFESRADREAAQISALRFRIVTGAAISALLVCVGFGWAAVAELSGAVVAHGTVVVDGHSKKVQHAQGGIVAEIRVVNGQRVVAGETLIRFDGTQARASLGIVSLQLAELTGRKARFIAERDMMANVVFPDSLGQIGADGVRIAEGEVRLFETRRVATASRKAQLAERIKQLEEEINGSLVQHHAKVRELALIREELRRVVDMQRRELIPITRVISLQRDEARIDGENGALLAQIARLRGQIAELQLQVGAIDQTVSSDSQKEIREIEARIGELQDRKLAAEDQLRRIDIRSPIDGVIHELVAHTVGGVIAAGEQMMLVVPDRDTLSVEVRVQSSDIDQLKVGQSSVLRFTAFNQRTTPEGSGRLTRIAPDISREAQSGQSYFIGRIAPDPGFLSSSEGQRLLPGMPVEVFIETSPRSVLSYALKPLTDHLARSFRER